MQFNAQTFRPTLGPGNLFSIEGTLVPRSLWPMGSVFIEYGNRPLRLILSDTGETYAATVPSMMTAHAMLGAGITRRIAAAIDLPIVLYQGFDSRTPDSEVPYTPTPSGVGDLRFMTKFRIINNDEGGFGLAATPELTFPSGSVRSFRGDGTFAIEPRLAADYRFKNGSFIALNLGYYLRTYNRTVDFGLVRVADTLRYGLGVGVSLAKGFSALGELVGAASFSRFEGGSFYAPLEGYIGARYTDPLGVEVTLGGGAGLTQAVGSAQVRLFLGVAYVPRGKPQPRPIEETPPPTVETPKSDEPDLDGDGIIGSADICPKEAGAKETQGCPDGDKDGIHDHRDKCPSQPGPASQQGCPVPGADSDKDGVADKSDRCPNQAGPADNNGCPDGDEDKDGIVDRLDKCPSSAGPKNNDGCPLLNVQATNLRLSRTIRFKPRSSALEPESKALVQTLAKAINDDSSIKKVRIQVTASGDKKAAKKLAASRALTLMAALVEADVPRKQLQIKPSKRPGDDEVSRIDIQRTSLRGKGELRDLSEVKEDKKTDVKEDKKTDVKEDKKTDVKEDKKTDVKEGKKGSDKAGKKSAKEHGRHRRHHRRSAEDDE